MKEEDFDGQNLRCLTPEIVPSNELAVIIKETGLEPTLAKEFTINFEEHFRMASEWAKKAKKIIVTDASQHVVMQEARTARLFLREKRLEIEKFRVSRKEYFLKGGRAIDKVANFLKDTIIPIEEHLDRQEHFVENLKKAEEARVLAEFHAKQEAEIKAKEEADRIALAKAQEENNRLRKEQEAKDNAQRIELDKIRKENEAKERAIRAENEAKLSAERAKAKKAEDELRLKREADAKAEADRIKAEESLRKADDVEKMRHLYNFIMSVKLPELNSTEGKKALRAAIEHHEHFLFILENYIKKNTLTEEKI